MSKTRFFLLLGLILFFSVSLYARGNGEKNSGSELEENQRRVQVTGVVRVVGSNPLYEFVISDQSSEWYIVRNEMNKFNTYQQQTVVVEGIETVYELLFAGGLSAGTRRELHNLRIISVQCTDNSCSVKPRR